jgi:hypothetical protein
MKKIFAITAICAIAVCANATVLTFDDANGDVAGTSIYGGSTACTGDGPVGSWGGVLFQGISQNYGDNVSATIQGGFGYGKGLHGWTPDITVSYPIIDDLDSNPYNTLGTTLTQPLRPYHGDLIGGKYVWGDSGLTNIIYPWLVDGYSICGANPPQNSDSYTYADIEITFTAANGKHVRLYSFDLGTYDTIVDFYNIDWEVRSGSDTGTVLKSGTATVAALQHVVIDANVAVSPTNGKLVLIAYTSLLGTYAPNVAMDNIEFGEDLATCGDINHPYPTYDFNQDCKVDFKDLAFIAQNWQKCSDPKPPCSYLP